MLNQKKVKIFLVTSTKSVFHKSPAKQFLEIAFKKTCGRFFCSCEGAIFAIAETGTIGVSPPVFCLC